MKKFSFLFSAMLILFVFNSCKQSVVDVQAPNAKVITIETSLKISNILALKSVDEQKLAYQTLDTIEKQTIWQTHLSDAIKSKMFNAEQNALIIELRDNLKTSFFKHHTSMAEISAFEKDWIRRSQSIFNVLELKSIVASLAPFNNLPTITVNKEESGGNGNCGCTTLSGAFCGSGFYCASTAQCTSTTDGCGWWWNYSCNGNCDLMTQS